MYSGEQHSLKSARILSFSGPHFSAFVLNCRANFRIESKCGKIRTRKTLNTDNFTPCGTFKKKRGLALRDYQCVKVKIIIVCFVSRKPDSVNLCSEHKKAAKISEYTFQKETWGEKEQSNKKNPKSFELIYQERQKIWLRWHMQFCDKGCYNTSTSDQKGAKVYFFKNVVMQLGKTSASFLLIEINNSKYTAQINQVTKIWLWDHSFSTYGNFSKKVIFFIP